jgi:hypothetical protein
MYKVLFTLNITDCSDLIDNALARVCSIGLEKPITPNYIHSEVSRILKELKGSDISSIKDFDIKIVEILTHVGIRSIKAIPRLIGKRVIDRYNPNLSDKMADAGNLVFLMS